MSCAGQQGSNTNKNGISGRNTDDLNVHKSNVCYWDNKVQTGMTTTKYLGGIQTLRA